MKPRMQIRAASTPCVWYNTEELENLFKQSDSAPAKQGELYMHLGETFTLSTVGWTID